jgi:hypothetical protein
MQITTTAPISLENLKKYYADKSTSYLIDYENSTLKEQKLLVYLSNLDLNCDVLINEFDDSFFSLLKAYFTSTSLVKVNFLESCAIDVLMINKGLVKSDIYTQFIADNQDIINEWSDRLDSCAVFNTYAIDDEATKNEALSYPIDDTDSVVGINWVSLLKNAKLNVFYSKVDQTKLKFYSKYFNDYMFKGQNLYSFWANENNMMFVLTWGILNGTADPVEFGQALQQSKQEQENVAVN